MKRLLAFFILLSGTPAFACDTMLAKYGQAKTVDFCLYVTDATVGAVKVENAVHAPGDTYIMKDEGNEAPTTNGFTDEGSCYSLVLTSTETQAARVTLNIEDQSTKTWADKCIVIETYGNASAEHAFDLDTASVSVGTGGLTKASIAGDGNLQSATPTGAVLASSESYGDNVLARRKLHILSGTGAGQSRVIASNVGSTDAVTIYGTWVTTPDNTSVYMLGDSAESNVTAWDDVDLPVAVQPGYPTSVLATGTGTGQILLSSGVVDANAQQWRGTALPAPATAGIPTVRLSASGVDDIWDEPTSGHSTAGSTGKALADAGAGAVSPTRKW